MQYSILDLRCPNMPDWIRTGGGLPLLFDSEEAVRSSVNARGLKAHEYMIITREGDVWGHV